jgi:hypothetical protein
MSFIRYDLKIIQFSVHVHFGCNVINFLFFNNVKTKSFSFVRPHVYSFFYKIPISLIIILKYVSWNNTVQYCSTCFTMQNEAKHLRRIYHSLTIESFQVNQILHIEKIIHYYKWSRCHWQYTDHGSRAV